MKNPLSSILVLAAVALTGPVMAQDEAPASPKAGEVEKDGAADAADAEDAKAKAKAEAKAKREAEREARRKAKELKRNGGRELDPESPVAEALDELLTVDPKYATDGTVHLTYTFREPTDAQDWESRGFDKADQTHARGWRRRRRAELAGAKTRFLSLAVGSSRKGVLRHTLAMRGEFEVTWTIMVDRMTKRSDLVFFTGKGGVRFGNQFVKSSGTSFRPAVRGSKPDVAPFADRQRAIVRFKVGSGKITAWVNGAKVGETDALEGKLDGQIGLFAKDMNLAVVQVEIKGEIDPRKL